MSRFLSSNALADNALREIGSFSPVDVSSNPVEHAITLDRLDMLIAELAGTEKFWFLFPSIGQRIPLAAGVASFLLSAYLDPLLQFYYSVRVVLANATDELPVSMIRRWQYDDIIDKTASGDPTCVYIERSDTPTCYVWPVPAAAGAFLVLDGEAYADTATDRGGQNFTNFTAAWYRFLTLQLAVDIGTGPVRTLPLPEIEAKQKRADQAKILLLSRQNRENADRPRLTVPWDPTRPVRRGYGLRDYGRYPRRYYGGGG